MNIVFPCLLTAICWGLSPVIYKTVLKNVNAETTIVLSAFVYFILALTYMLVHTKKIKEDVAKLNMKTIWFLIIANLVVFIGQIIYISCLQKEKSSLVATLTYTSPLFTLLFAYLLINEKINMTAFIGIIMVIIGIVLLSKNT